MLIARGCTKWLPSIFLRTSYRRLATSRERLVYTPLQGEETFRLLKLHQSQNQNDQIECVLQHTSLDSAPCYEALSYVWGEETPNGPDILVNGQKLKVTHNLHSALAHLRLQNRTLWIDAICINQDDPDERTEQVLQMPRIFGSASRALAWLGNETETTRDAFAHVRHMCTALQEYSSQVTRQDSYPPVEDFRSWYVYEFVDYSRRSELKRTVRAETAFWSLLSNSWFERIWIVQELAVAPSVVLVSGDLELAWDRLATTVNLYRSLYSRLPPQHAERLERASILQTVREDVQDGFRIPGGNASLLTYLRDLRSFDSTDARDKSFALAGLVGDGYAPELAPNYSVDNTSLQVYQRIAVYYLQQAGDLSILHHAGCDVDNQVDKQLPSWVPDWRHKRVWRPTQRSNDAAGSTCATYRLSHDKTVLTVRGRAFDSVSLLDASHEYHSDGTKADPTERLGEALIPAGDFDIDLTATAETIVEIERPLKVSLREFFDQVLAIYKDQRHYASGEKLEEAVLRTLFWGPQDVTEALGYLHSNRLTTERLLEALKFLPDDGTASGPDVHAALMRMLKYSWWQNWCVTSGGYFGWVPQRTKAGDVVAVIDGMSFPFILRKVRGEQFELIGECCIHGIMNGEVIQDHTAGIQDIDLV